MNDDRRLSTREVARYLGVKRHTIYNWIARKQMPAQKAGRLWSDGGTRAMGGYKSTGEASEIRERQRPVLSTSARDDLRWRAIEPDKTLMTGRH